MYVAQAGPKERLVESELYSKENVDRFLKNLVE